MDELTDLEHIRKRPGMYVGDTSVWGLHRLFLELLDNTIDQFLVDRATFVRAEANGPLLVFTDDGPGLPFDVPNTPNQSLATYYLTVFRRNLPTADGHVPHVHLSGFGCGLPLVTGLTETCDVTSWRNGDLWHQTLSRGVERNPPKIIERETDGRGTAFRLTVDRGIFDAEWCPRRIDEQLTEAAYLFPGLRVKSPTLSFSTNRGLADLAVKRAVEAGAGDVDQSWWFNDSHGDIHIQAALAGRTDGDTQWGAFANGRSVEKGAHLTALKRVVSACKLRPAVALIHVIMLDPRFAGPTRSNLDSPEIQSPIYQALKPDLMRFSEAS